MSQENQQDTQNIEEQIDEEAAAQAQAEIDAIVNETDEITYKEQLAQLNESYLRLMAEYDNFRKRTMKERDELYPNAMATAVSKFLPVLDNIERAAAYPHADDDFGKGFDLIHQSFQSVLESLGVEAMGESGEPFDPALHNAVMHIEDATLGENVISMVLQKGYRIGDKVIRYAMVQTAN